MDTELPPTPLVKSTSWLTAPVAILLGAAMISGAVLYTGGNKNAAIAPGATEAPIVIKDPSTLFTASDPVLGNAKAKVTIVEFSDFQCPFCRQFFIDSYPQIKSQYIDTGKVRMIYRDYPLPFHPAAKPAALAAQCANDQGKFWAMHDKIFSEQQKKEPDQSVVSTTLSFTTSDLKAWAGQIGLEMKQFTACFDSGKYNTQSDASIKAGSGFGVSGTPTFFINGKILIGAQPFSVFQAAIDAALAGK